MQSKSYILSGGSIFLILCFFISVLFGQQNIIINGDLEMAEPFFWHPLNAGDGNSIVSWNSDESYQDFRSLKIFKPDVSSDVVGWISENNAQRYWNRMTDDVMYELRGYIKTSEVNTNPSSDDERIGLSFKFFDAGNALIAEIFLTADQTVANMDWHEVNSSVVIPPGSVPDSMICVAQFGKDASGTAWFDLITVGSDPWTAMMFGGEAETPMSWMYWTQPGSDELAMYDNSEAHSGTYSAKLQENDDENDEIVFYSIPFPVEEEHYYLISSWIKTEGVNTDPQLTPTGVTPDRLDDRIGICFFYHLPPIETSWNLTAPGDLFFYIDQTVNSHDWRKYEAIWKAPSGAAGISMRARYTSFPTGTTWFDDFSVREVVNDSIIVIYPNGGENLFSGQDYDIAWTSTESIIDVKIEYSIDSGTNWSIIAASTPNDGLYTWNVPNTPSSNCLIRVTDFNGTPSDESNAHFTINPGEPVTDFSADLVVSDTCANSINLVFGTASDATDGYDEAYDQYAPPPPPSGAFDARFHIPGDDLLRDFRATNSLTIEWDLEFVAASGCGWATVQWNPAQLPDDGSTFSLVDFFTSGSLVDVDMRTNSSHADVDNYGHYKIISSLIVPCDVDLVSGWNMIGVSVEPLDAVAANLFPNMIPPLYRFIGSYDPVTMVENGVGYWERNTVNETVSIQGFRIESITLSLMNGWNMIAGPTCTVAIADVTDPLGIIIPGTLYGFDGAYFPSIIIERCKGYWLRTNAAGDITLNCPEVTSGILAKATGQLPQLDEFGRLEITDAAGAQQTLYLNVELEDEAMIESYSLPPLPPAGLFDARFCSGYRISPSDEELIQLQASEYPVSISISNAVHDSAYAYVITEVVGNEEIAEHMLGEGETVEITNPKVTLLKLSKKDMLAIPTDFAVSQNYPNPFNPTTEIEYALPENEKVTIVIYNQLGQKVKTFLAQNQEAGYHKVIWDGMNENGRLVASGIYFYTITAGKNIAIKKMIFLK